MYPRQMAAIEKPTTKDGEIRYRGLSISEVLALRVEHARDLFKNVPDLAATLGVGDFRVMSNTDGGLT